MLNAGAVLADRFQIDRLAGRGGAGVVYRGVDRASGAPVAIKMAHEDDDADYRRFEREAATLASLRHPAIVTYVGHGRAGGQLYLVMEWLEGEDLGARLKA